MQVCHKAGDYEALIDLLGLAGERLPMRVPGYCFMPNHFHLVLWPFEDGDMSCWMQWFTTSHVRRYHRHYESSGHVWQGRFKSFPVQDDEHLLTVLRYVERNPLRANLVARAEDWEWSSLRWWQSEKVPDFMAVAPIERPENWLEWVNSAETASELAALRGSAQRGRPYGSPHWQTQTARQLGLESTLRPRGRPRKRAR